MLSKMKQASKLPREEVRLTTKGDGPSQLLPTLVYMSDYAPQKSNNGRANLFPVHML